MEKPGPADARFRLSAPTPAGRIPLSLILLLVGINLLWAGSSLAAKIALVSIPPMTLAFTRFSLAALLMYGAVLALKVDLRVARRDWGAFWAMGILGLAFTYLLCYEGLRLTTVSNFALLHTVETVFLAFLAFLFLHEAMPRTKLLGIFVGLVGVFLIIAQGFTLGLFSKSVLGNLLIALALIFEASASIIGKGLLARYRILTVVTYQMLTGAIALAPFCFSELAAHRFTLALPPMTAWWSLMYLILPCTVFGYMGWFTALDKRRASEMSIFLLIQPVAGAFLGVLFQGDTLTAFTLLGTLLVFLAVFLVNRRPALSLTPPIPPA